MGIFYKTSKQLLQVNAAVLALFIFGPGLSLPSQSSSGPASTCAAPYQFYEHVALLHHLFLFAIVASCFLASQVLLAVAAEEGESPLAPAAARLRARLGLLLAIAFSAAAAGLALGVYSYVLQIKYTVFSCMPDGVRFVIFAADAVVAVVTVYAYYSFVRSAVYGA